jgi:hypothetical protein
MEGDIGVIGGVRARGAILARIAGTLIDVHVAVSTMDKVLHTLKYFAVFRVLGYEVILTPPIGEPCHTGALIGMEAHCDLCGRLGARGTILTRVAVALVHIDIAVSSR